MAGWIIQGVRGEGKSLAAVAKIKEYMLRGCPVATNLDLYLDKFLPPDNSAIAYRLPDHPDIRHFEALPPAYDVDYKFDDKNGLLVLDELGTWINSRNWSAKGRLELMSWLFLSRKLHWDIILLAQDYEMIDSQLRNTLCDYLVQASRLDRQKIPYLSGIIKMFGLSGMMPRVHRYHVYYGMSFQSAPVETWQFTGKDFYNGYNTNQIFRNGQEVVVDKDGAKLVDMRAVYSYVPACYLSNHIFIDRLNKQIDVLKSSVNNNEVVAVAQKKGVGDKGALYVKMGLLVLALVGFLGYRFFTGGLGLPKSSVPVAAVVVPSALVPDVAVPVSPLVPVALAVPPVVLAPADIDNDFVLALFTKYRPRLSSLIDAPTGFFGAIEFYDNDKIIESYKITELHALGVAMVRKPYGINLLYKNKTYMVTAWTITPVELPVNVSLDSTAVLPALALSENLK